MRQMRQMPLAGLSREKSSPVAVRDGKVIVTNGVLLLPLDFIRVLVSKPGDSKS